MSDIIPILLVVCAVGIIGAVLWIATVAAGLWLVRIFILGLDKALRKA